MTNKVKIVINDIPPSLNKYLNMHWAKRNETKKDWKKYIVESILKSGLTLIKSNDIIITITYYFKTKASHDFDNYSGKWIMDGLKLDPKSKYGNVGLILDDSSKHIKELRIRFGVVDKDNPRTEIELEYEDNPVKEAIEQSKTMPKNLTLKKLDKVLKEAAEMRTHCDICGKPSVKLIKGIDQVTNKLIMFCGKCMLG